jgi:putative endonuclease
MYTGYTKDLNNRIKLHAAGRGSKYVKSRLPLQLIFSEDYSNRSEAMRREIQIKKFSRSKKLNLIKNNTIISDTMLDKTLHI